MCSIEIHSEEKFPVKYGTSSYGTQIYWKCIFSIYLEKIPCKTAGLQAHFAAVFRCPFYLQGSQGHLFQLQLTTFFHSKYNRLTDKFISVFTSIIVLSFVTIESSARRDPNRSSDSSKGG